MASEATVQAARTDPRIKRTREHVIRTAREMLEEGLEPLTFTAVAERAFVARQTLYKHWGTVENLIAETVNISPVVGTYDRLNVPARASAFFGDVAGQLATGGTGAAVAAIVSASNYDPASKASVDKIEAALHASFNEIVGQVDRDGFIEIVGPVLYLALAGASPSAALLASLSKRAADVVR